MNTLVSPMLDKSPSAAAGWRGSMFAAIVIAVVLALALLASWLMTPTRSIAKSMPVGDLATQIPAAFGSWRLDDSVAPIPPTPDLQASLDRIYSQVFAKTYINRAGQRVMLSLAYGENESDSHRLHQPEGCYGGQGFAVGASQVGTVTLNGQALPVTRFVARMQGRVEPVTYWALIGSRAASTNWSIKKAQLSYGLFGEVPDGLLIRVSSINADASRAYALQQEFLSEWFAGVGPLLHHRLESALSTSR